MKSIATIILFLISSTFYAQEKTDLQDNISAEKIYLQIDRTAYTTDQTVWFKAIVTDAFTHRSSALSGVLYVELIAPDETIVERKLLKIVEGSGNSFFELHDNLIAGNYLVRAYTEWNKNFGSDFTFEQYIQIFSSEDEDSQSPITGVSLVEKKAGQFWLTARLRPNFLDNTKKHKLDVYLDIDGEKDTLNLKLKGEGQQFLDYEVPNDTHLATITLETEDKRKYQETISLNNKLVDLQFFPESGVMINGLLSKVGFKVLNDKGLGVAVKGGIYTSDDRFVTSFKSNDLGMGTFFLTPRVGSSYHAKIEGSENEVLVEYPLPEAAEKGSILAVLNAHKNIGLTVSSNYQISDSIFIKVQHRGKDIFLIKGQLSNGQMKTSLPKKQFPEGILVFTLVTNDKQPLAQRLYFNEKLNARLNVEVSPEKKTYATREKTSLEVALATSTGDPIQGNVSVLVIDKGVLEAKTNRNNIVSYFLMDSELTGEIENPSTYFDLTNRNRLNDLDALMLTQGWRKYVFRNPKVLQYNPESRLNLRGVVYSGISKKKRKKEVNLKLLTFGKSPTFHEYTTDSLGRFNFELYDAYGPPIEVLVQSANIKDKIKNYHISLDEKKTPKMEFDHLKSIRDLDSVIEAQVKIERNRSSIKELFEMTNGVTQLDEVVVEAARLTPQKKIMLDTYGPADVVIQGEEIQAKEKKWSYGLYSILLFNYPEQITIERFPDGFMLAHINGGGTTLVVIDGVPVVNFNYHLIPHIPPSEVKSVELIKHVAHFSRLYLKVFPTADPMKVPHTGSIISIYTHGGFGIHAIDKPIGILKSTIPVFSLEREFYAPRYDTTSKEELKKPDLRSLIHWEPEIKLNALNKAKIDFYNSDVSGEKLILIEAISEDGKVGYHESVYNVIDSNH